MNVKNKINNKKKLSRVCSPRSKKNFVLFIENTNKTNLLIKY